MKRSENKQDKQPGIDTNDVTLLCDRLRLDENDGYPIPAGEKVVESGRQNLDRTLLGKIWGRKIANKTGLTRVIKLIWKTDDDVRVEKTEKVNVFTFVFESVEDRRRIYEGGPWLFDKQLISLVIASGLGDLNSVDFSLCSFWIHVVNVPLALRSVECAKTWGNSLGLVEANDLSGPVMRITVRLDVREPLRRGFRVILEDTKEEMSFPLQYEKLPEFCHGCGVSQVSGAGIKVWGVVTSTRGYAKGRRYEAISNSSSAPPQLEHLRQCI